MVSKLKGVGNEVYENLFKSALITIKFRKNGFLITLKRKDCHDAFFLG